MTDNTEQRAAACVTLPPRCGEPGAGLCAACSLPAHELTQEPGCGAPIASQVTRQSRAHLATVERERIARIIDPEEWALDDLAKAKGFRAQFIHRSLAKADAILAAQPAPVSEGERLRAFVERIAGASSHPRDGEPDAKRLARVIREQRRDARNLLDTLTTPPPTDPVACAEKLRAAVVEECAQAACKAMAAMEWPPQDGDEQIDEVMAAVRAIAALSPSSPVEGGE